MQMSRSKCAGVLELNLSSSPTFPAQPAKESISITSGLQHRQRIESTRLIVLHMAPAQNDCAAQARQTGSMRLGLCEYQMSRGQPVSWSPLRDS